MIDDIINALNPVPYYDNIVDFIFPLPNNEDEIVISPDEKKLIVDQITEVKKYLNSAKRCVKDGNFDKAIHDVENAIDASTCSKCKEKMILTGFDIEHTSNICDIDIDVCEENTSNIIKSINDFMNDYLPRVEYVLSAREK